MSQINTEAVFIPIVAKHEIDSWVLSGNVLQYFRAMRSFVRKVNNNFNPNKCFFLI